MAISLAKGSKVNILEEYKNLNNIIVALGWEAPDDIGGVTLDLDASAFLLNRDNRVRFDNDFIFYNELSGENGSVVHKGDSEEGGSGGDDEEIHISLRDLPLDVMKVSFAVSIHDAKDKRQDFSMVKNAYIRVINKDNNQEIARFDLTEYEDPMLAGIIIGEMERDLDTWQFKALGESVEDGLFRIAYNYGVNIAPM